MAPPGARARIARAPAERVGAADTVAAAGARAPAERVSGADTVVAAGCGAGRRRAAVGPAVHPGRAILRHAGRCIAGLRHEDCVARERPRGAAAAGDVPTQTNRRQHARDPHRPAGAAPPAARPPVDDPPTAAVLAHPHTPEPSTARVRALTQPSTAGHDGRPRRTKGAVDDGALRVLMTGLKARAGRSSAGGTNPASCSGVARCGFAGRTQPSRPSGRAPPGSRKNLS
jgi:hypothetical protein